MLSDFLAHPPLSLFSTSRMTLSLGRVIIAPISPRRDDAPVNCGTHPIAWRSIRVRTRFLSHYHSHGTHARVVLTRPMTAPKPKPRGGQRRAIARHHSAPKTITRVRFERQLQTYWGSSWLVLLMANLAAAAGANTLGPPPLERPQEPPARESSGGYDSDASLGSICDFIVGWNEARRHKKNGRRFGRKLRLRSSHRLEVGMC